MCPLSTFAPRQISGQPQQRPAGRALAHARTHNDSVGPRSCWIRIEAAPNAFEPASATHPIGPGGITPRPSGGAGWVVWIAGGLGAARWIEDRRIMTAAGNVIVIHKQNLTIPVPTGPKTQTAGSLIPQKAGSHLIMSDAGIVGFVGLGIMGLGYVAKRGRDGGMQRRVAPAPPTVGPSNLHPQPHTHLPPPPPQTQTAWPRTS